MTALGKMLGQTLYQTLQQQQPEVQKILKNSQKKKQDARSVNSFLMSLEDNKEAFELFKHEAIKKGIYKGSPLPEIHHNYYHKYIRPNQDVVGGSSSVNRSGIQSLTESTMSKREQQYIPLRDLLRQNHEERVQGYLDSMKEDNLNILAQGQGLPKQKQQYHTVDNRKNNSVNQSMESIGSPNFMLQPHQQIKDIKVKNNLGLIVDTTHIQASSRFARNKLEQLTPFITKDPNFNVKDQGTDPKRIQTPNQITQIAQNVSIFQDQQQQVLPDINNVKKGSQMTTYSPQLRSKVSKYSKLQQSKDSVQQSQLSAQYDMKLDLSQQQQQQQQPQKRNPKQQNLLNHKNTLIINTQVGGNLMGGLMLMQHNSAQPHLMNQNQSLSNYLEENTSGDEESIVNKNKNNVKYRQHIKLKDFQLDRKDQALQNYFNSFANEKRLNKNKIKEFLAKRYKDLLAERILKNIQHHFNNFSFNLEFGIYCESVENFVNQDETALKMFVFKILDVNNDKKLSESDLFQIMRMSSNGAALSSTKLDDPSIFQDNDLFLDIFSNDFCKIIKNINLKRRVRGRDDMYQNKLKAIESKLQNLEMINQQHLYQSFDNSAQMIGGSMNPLAHNTSIIGTNRGGVGINIANEKISLTKMSKKMHQKQIKMSSVSQARKNPSNLKIYQQVSKESNSSFDDGEQQKQQNQNNDSTLGKGKQLPQDLSKSKLPGDTSAHVTNSNNEDQQDYLSFSEFCNISFRNGLPALVNDLVMHLTNKSIIKGNQIWEEDDEHSPLHRTSNIDNEGFHDQDIQIYKNSMPQNEYNTFLNIFKKFLNIDMTNKKANMQFKDANCFLTEEIIVENLPQVFGYSCPYFAKLFYLLLSNGFDKSKIGISRLIQVFLPLLKKEEQIGAHNKFAFRIYDMDRDGILNILNLLHLQQNISPTSIVGQEVQKLMDFYFTKNVKSKNVIRKIDIDFEIFSKIIRKSVLVDELRFKLFGIGQANTQHIFDSDDSIPFKQGYLFKDLNLEEEQTLGQRQFAKNMDKNLAELIKFYNKYYNKQNNEQGKEPSAINITEKKRPKDKNQPSNKNLKD